MFADYRVPQILQRLGVLTYPQCLMEVLRARNSIDSGSVEEISIRSASILAVEEIRKEIGKLKDCEEDNQGAILEDIEVTSVIIDFWLWDMAKRIESGENVDVALSLAQTARRILPDSPQTADTLGWVYFYKGEFGSGRDLLESALKTTPDDASMHFHLGMIYEKLSDKPDAQLHLKKAATLAPNSKIGHDATEELQKLG